MSKPTNTAELAKHEIAVEHLEERLQQAREAHIAALEESAKLRAVTAACRERLAFFENAHGRDLSPEYHGQQNTGTQGLLIEQHKALKEQMNEALRHESENLASAKKADEEATALEAELGRTRTSGDTLARLRLHLAELAVQREQLADAEAALEQYCELERMATRQVDKVGYLRGQHSLALADVALGHSDAQARADEIEQQIEAALDRQDDAAVDVDALRDTAEGIATRIEQFATLVQDADAKTRGLQMDWLKARRDEEGARFVEAVNAFAAAFASVTMLDQLVKAHGGRSALPAISWGAVRIARPHLDTVPVNRHLPDRGDLFAGDSHQVKEAVSVALEAFVAKLREQGIELD